MINVLWSGNTDTEYLVKYMLENDMKLEQEVVVIEMEE